MWSYGGAVASRGANPPPPTQGPTRATLTGAEPPERRGAGGRFLWVPARVRSDPNFAPVASGSWGASTDRGRCLAATEALLAWPARGAGTPASRSPGQGGPPPSLCLRGIGGGCCRGESERCSRSGCPDHYRPAPSASRPNVVIRRVAASEYLEPPKSFTFEPPPPPLPAPPTSSRARPHPLPVT